MFLNTEKMDAKPKIAPFTIFQTWWQSTYLKAEPLVDG
jgi:hypothetical protein